MEIFDIKSWDTQGIIIRHVMIEDLSELKPGDYILIKEFTNNKTFHHSIYRKWLKDCFLTREEAMKRVEVLREAEILKLSKRLEKIRNINLDKI